MERITVTEEVDAHERSGVLGDLTVEQYEKLEEVARLSPETYSFEVVRYDGETNSEATSEATHVKVLVNGELVGLVGLYCFQFYDKKMETYKTCLRVAHKVYRDTPSLSEKQMATLV